MFQPVPVQNALRMINHGPVVLATSMGNETPADIAAFSWSTPASSDPLLLVLAVHPKRHTHKLIEESGEFVLNIPNVNLLKQTQYCGTVSGRDTDKFAGSGLTQSPSKVVNTPGIAECIGHIECKVENKFTVGDHTFFVGRAVYAEAQEGLFDGYWDINNPDAKTIHHLGGTVYTYPAEIISP